MPSGVSPVPLSSLSRSASAPSGPLLSIESKVQPIAPWAPCWQPDGRAVVANASAADAPPFVPVDVPPHAVADDSAIAASERVTFESWDTDAIAGLLTQEPEVVARELLQLMDPEAVWGVHAPAPTPQNKRPRGVLEGDFAAAACEARRKAMFLEPKAWRRGTMIKHAASSLVLDGDVVGFAECAVVRCFEEKELQKCRICFGTDCDLLDACACRGTMRYVCAECLVKQWQSKGSELRSLNNLRCGLCNQQFTGRAAELLGRGLGAVVREEERKAPTSSHPNQQAERHLAEITSATALWQQGSFKEAAELFRKAITGLTVIRGAEDAATLSAQHNLSLVLLAQGNVPEAEQRVRLAKAGFAKLFGPEHPLCLKAAHNEAMAVQTRGRVREAIGLYTETLEARRRVLGLRHIDTLKTSCNLGLALLRAGEAQKAEVSLRGTVGSLEQVVGRKHPLALTALQNLSLAISRHTPASLESEQLAHEVVEGRRLTLGEEHPETLEGLRDWASVLAAAGRGAEAEAAGRRALRGMERSLGFDHPTTQETLRQLAAICKGEGKESEAESLLQEHCKHVVVEAAQAPQPEALGSLVLFGLCIYVKPSMRRQGLGRAVVDRWKAIARECSASALDVRIADECVDCVEFFMSDAIGMTEAERYTPLEPGGPAAVHLRWGI